MHACTHTCAVYTYHRHSHTLMQPHLLHTSRSWLFLLPASQGPVFTTPNNIRMRRQKVPTSSRKTLDQITHCCPEAPQDLKSSHEEQGLPKGLEKMSLPHEVVIDSKDLEYFIDSRLTSYLLLDFLQKKINFLFWNKYISTGSCKNHTVLVPFPIFPQ